jgi:hypothetical protein
MKDFRDEVECYLNVKPIVELMDAMSFDGIPSEDIQALYRNLVEGGFVKESEVEILDSWLTDFDKATRRA